MKNTPAEVVYISGPIAGKPNGNREAFEKRAAELKEAGYAPVNPHDVMPYQHSFGRCRGRELPGYPHSFGKHNYNCYLIGDIVALAECDRINMLDGWEASPGANAEFYFAKACEIKELVL